MVSCHGMLVCRSSYFQSLVSDKKNISIRLLFIYLFFYKKIFPWTLTVAEPGCFHRGGQGGASNQSGVAQKYSLFQYM